MILTIEERELASYLRSKGLSYSEIAYLKWKSFDFEGDKLTLDRKTGVIKYRKTVDLKENPEIHHIVKTLEGKRRYLRTSYYVFYEQFPVTTCRRDDNRRYGSPFTPDKMREMVAGYSVTPEERPLFGLKLVRV